MRNVPSVAFIAFTLSIWLWPAVAYGQPAARRYDGYQVVRITIDDESQLRTLMALDAASRDFQVWSDGVGLGVIDVRVSPQQKRLLDASGLRYEVEIEDLQRRLDEMFKGAEEPDFFDSYRTYDEHIAFLNDLAAAYPDLAQTFSVGTSVLGRPMWAIRITGPGEDKPGVMYHGNQHGNEVMGGCVVAYMAEYLLTHYDSDPDVHTLVDNVEWFLLTIMNPDGYVETSRPNANGVDLNRNWGGPGAYPNPFSEPETAAMRDFFLSHPNVRAHLDFHTYGRMILWPWGYTSELCEDNAAFDHLGDEMAELIFQVRGSDYDQRGPVNTTIYPVFGGSVDYSYGELGLWAMAFELGYSHSMPTSEIMPTCEEIAPAMLFLSGWISDCNENGVLDSEDIASGFSTDDNGNAMPDECECAFPSPPQPDPIPNPSEAGYGTKNRYLSFVAGDPGREQAVHVTFTSVPGFEYAENRTMWVQEPSPVTEAPGSSGGTPPPTFWAATLGCDPYYTDWSQYNGVDVYDDGIIPGATYEVRATHSGCDPDIPDNYSDPLEVVLSEAGDVVGLGPFGGVWDAPQGMVDFNDVTAVVDKFKGTPGSIRKARADITNGDLAVAKPDWKVDFVDIYCAVGAFRANPCPVVGPPTDDPCPQP